MMTHQGAFPSSEHLSYEQVLRYLTDALTSDDRDAVEIHLETCRACGERVDSLQHRVDEARQQTCPLVRPLFAAYAAGLLPPDQATWVRSHLLVCEDCMAHYITFVDAQLEGEWEDETDEASPAAVKPRVIHVEFGQVQNFPALIRPERVGQPVKLAARGEAETPARPENIQEWWAEDVRLTIGLDINDHLCVELASSHYDVGDTRISLCESRETGAIEVYSVVTDATGKADFGPIRDLQAPERGVYVIVAASLKHPDSQP